MSVTYQPFPWQRGQWTMLQRDRGAGRLHHALLLVGPRGLGKLAFAEGLAKSLLCRTPDAEGLPCGHCHSCNLVAAGTHPDLLRVEPEEPEEPEADSKTGEIKVEAIRELIERETKTAQLSGPKVVLLHPADRLNRSAANSLLKTLEEPVPSTLLVLIGERPSQLLPTIRSRCRQVAFALPAEADTVAWLRERKVKADPLLLSRLGAGAPLAALALDDEGWLAQRRASFGDFRQLVAREIDATSFAKSLQGIDMAMVLNWISTWIGDMLRLRSGYPSPRLSNPDVGQELAGLADQIQIGTLHRLLGKVYEAIRLQDSTLNPQLMLEDLFICLSVETPGA